MHAQLLRQLAGSALLPGGALPKSLAAPELPSQKVLILLQRAIAAGWADQVTSSTSSGQCCQYRSQHKRQPDRLYSHIKVRHAQHNLRVSWPNSVLSRMDN